MPVLIRTAQKVPSVKKVKTVMISEPKPEIKPKRYAIASNPIDPNDNNKNNFYKKSLTPAQIEKIQLIVRDLNKTSALNIYENKYNSIKGLHN